MEFSLNIFNEFAEFSEKKIKKIKQEDCRVGTQDLLCKRERLYHSVTETQATEQILILNPIHVSVISQILWICWIHWIQWSSDPFREKPIVFKPTVSHVRNQHVTAVPQRHGQQRRSLIDANSGFSDLTDSLNSLNALKVQGKLHWPGVCVFKWPAKTVFHEVWH